MTTKPKADDCPDCDDGKVTRHDRDAKGELTIRTETDCTRCGGTGVIPPPIALHPRDQ